MVRLEFEFLIEPELDSGFVLLELHIPRLDLDGDWMRMGIQRSQFSLTMTRI